MGSSTENLILGFQPASSATQPDAFGGPSTFTAGTGELEYVLQGNALDSTAEKRQFCVMSSLKGGKTDTKCIKNTNTKGLGTENFRIGLSPQQTRAHRLVTVEQWSKGASSIGRSGAFDEVRNLVNL